MAVEDHLKAFSSSHLHTASFPAIPAKHIIGMSLQFSTLSLLLQHPPEQV